MIRRLVFLIVFLVVIGLIIMSPYIAWIMGPSKDLRITVVTKTVPFVSYKEHGSVFWVLNHLRYPAPEGHDAWALSTDHVGYYPGLRYVMAQLKGVPEAEARWWSTWRSVDDGELAGTNVLYLADTYGAYELDLKHIDTEEEHRVRNPPVYGGLTDDEMGAIERFVGRGGHIVAEFNSFALPTETSPRQRLEKVLHVDWSHWIGRFVEDLSDPLDLPWWVYELWKKTHGATSWHFSGPGFIFFDTKENLVVLQVGTDIGDELCKIYNVDNNDPVLRGVSDAVPYNYWFDIVRPGKGTTVHSEFVIDVRPEGQKKLDEWGIPSRFPAITSWKGAYQAWYFAGDFGDTVVEDEPYGVAWYPSYKRYFARYRQSASNEWFFWEYYLPLMENVLGGMERN